MITKHCPNGRWFHGHDWVVGVVERVITVPKRGPYDPRTDAQRTRKHTLDICALCGKEIETQMYYDF